MLRVHPGSIEFADGAEPDEQKCKVHVTNIGARDATVSASLRHDLPYGAVTPMPDKAVVPPGNQTIFTVTLNKKGIPSGTRVTGWLMLMEGEEGEVAGPAVPFNRVDGRARTPGIAGYLAALVVATVAVVCIFLYLQYPCFFNSNMVEAAITGRDQQDGKTFVLPDGSPVLKGDIRVGQIPYTGPVQVNSTYQVFVPSGINTRCATGGIAVVGDITDVVAKRDRPGDPVRWSYKAEAGAHEETLEFFTARAAEGGVAWLHYLFWSLVTTVWILLRCIYARDPDPRRWVVYFVFFGFTVAGAFALRQAPEWRFPAFSVLCTLGTLDMFAWNWRGKDFWHILTAVVRKPVPPGHHGDA
jgi:hypothetical protein